MDHFSATLIDGTPVNLNRYRGQVRLIVNVASRCGFTPQYRGLEALYRRFKTQGFVVLGFPCNQFGGQEPGTDTEIQDFCTESFDLTFPMFARVEVNGPNAHPLFTFLKTQKRGFLGSAAIKWNFTKFLVNREGVVVARYGSRSTPGSIEAAIRRLLGP